MVGESFQIYGVQIIGNMYLQVKKLNLDIFSHASQTKIFPRFSSHHKQREITHSPREGFFENPPSKKASGVETVSDGHIFLDHF